MKENQKGVVTIMEAVFVFPIMFFVVWFMLMAGEVYYQHARVEQACMTAAIQGAARCENPMLEAVQKNEAVPTRSDAVKVRPYRYILTSEAKNIAAEISGELKTTVEGFQPMAFRGMSPSNVSVVIQPKMNVLVSSFPVECSFDIKLPIRMIFSNEDWSFRYTVSVSEPIGDPAEFVRNVSTVQDYLERIQFSDGITSFAQKVKKAINQLARFMN